MKQWENENMGWILNNIKNLLCKCDNESVVIFLKESSYIWDTHRYFV